MTRFNGKTASLYRHAQSRALQREGLILGKRSLQAMAQSIQQQKAKFCRSHSLRVTEWLVEWGGKSRRVLYDKKRKCIITFLPS